MLYTPKYCCNCGEVVERIDQNWRSSGRFCDTCAIQFKEVELLPKVFAFVMTVIGLLGIGSFLMKSEKPLELKSTQISQVLPGERKDSTNQRNFSANSLTTAAQTSNNLNVQPQTPIIKTATQNNSPNGAAQASEKQIAVENNDPVYFCGAATKKGTPCSRRVKGGGRCWQHQGQTAMLPPEKLLISGKS